MNFVNVFGLVTLSIPLFVIVTRYYSSSSPKSEQQQEKEQVELEEEEEEVIINSVSWSELDPDVLGEIVSRLCLTDQARFLVVCKNWLAAAHPIINTTTTKEASSSSSLPWHGCIIAGSSQFQIFDPLSSTPNHLASIQNISWSNLGIPSPSSTVFLSEVKHNWLFLTFLKPGLFYWTRRYSLLFSPLTKKVITLPRFDYPRRFKFTSTFSTQPDSPDCVYCMIDANHHKIAVIIYHNGDKEWTAREFNKVPAFRSRAFYPLILNGGIIYIVSRFGQVASYNILNGEFNFDCLLLDELLVKNARSKRMELFVLNEEPIILYYDPNPKNILTRPGRQCIKRYDRSRKVWIPVRTLLGYALFVSEKITGVSLINTKDTRNNGVLSNKIYHFVNGGCHVYSIEDGNLVRFKFINSNLLEDGGGELPEYKFNYGIPGGSAYWLKTPCVRSSSDNQEVHGFRDEGKQGTLRALG